MMDKEEIIEAINQWPVSDDHTSVDEIDLLTIDNPSSVASFFLRNVKRGSRGGNPPAEATVKEKQDKDVTHEVLADTALAKWWRKEGKTAYADFKLPDSNNPNTILSYISRYQPGIDFFKGEVKRLRKKIQDGEARSANIHAALASYYDRLGNLSIAKMHLETAIEKDPQEPSYQWLMWKVRRQTEIRQIQEKALSQLNITSKHPGSTLMMPSSKQVRRVSAKDLTFEEFFYKYELTSTPVIITGIVDKMTSEPWTFQHVKDKIGDVSVNLKTAVNHSAEWARLEESQTMGAAQFIQSVCDSNSSGQAETNGQYLFDWSLPLHCPDLIKELTIPKYFSGDLLQRTAAGSLYQDSWPSLFVADAGLCSDLHVDTFGSNFWMALFQGRKRWLFFSKEDTPLLYPTYHQSMDPVFDVNLASPDLSTNPLLSLTQPIECELQPGELLFVPAGCPHRVENLEKSLAISGNYVDLSNLELVKQELTISALRDPRSADLLSQVTSPDFKCNMSSDVQDLTWEEFKSQSYDDHSCYNITPEMVAHKLTKMEKT